MKSLRNYIPMTLLVLLVIAAVHSFPRVAHAQGKPKWTLKAGLALVDTSAPFAIDKPSGGQVHAGGNAELGLNVALQYRWSELMSLELGTVYSRSPNLSDAANGNNEQIGEGPGFFPLIAGANLHLVDTVNVDFYVGPRVALVHFGDFDLNIDGENTAFAVDDEFAWGASAGVNYRIGDGRWSLLAEVTVLELDMTVNERRSGNSYTSGFDPLLVNLGLTYSF